MACFVFARRFAALKQWGWVAGSIGAAVAGLGLASSPDPNGLSVRLVIATAILLGFIAAVAARVRADLPKTPATFRPRPRSKPDRRTLMRTVTSNDGTTIAFDQSGAGPALILVGGLFEQRAMDSETSHSRPARGWASTSP